MIGRSITRLEGHAKVTGKARYAADNNLARVLHAVLVGAPIANGRVLSIDTEAAQRVRGVVRVLTHSDMPRFGAVSFPSAILKLPMQDDVIRHEGTPVAIVLAESLESAEEGAGAVVVRARSESPLVPRDSAGETPVRMGFGEDLNRGDVPGALQRAAHRVEQRFIQPARHHNPMEPSATVAEWFGDTLFLYDSVQAGFNLPPVMAAVFGIDAKNVRVIAPHTGGGFGCKGWVWPHEILAAAAARVAGRPVKLVLTRAQMYANVGYQPLVRQDIALGCDAEGKLAALRHDVVNTTSIVETWTEAATEISRGLYAVPALQLTQRVERVHANLPTAMRAPAEGPGSWALESAMDELALLLRMDPLDLRLANYAQTDPVHGKPWSSNKLREAYAEGARLFGWRERGQLPRHDGPWRIGFGMAACTMTTFRHPAAARVRLQDDGGAVVEAGTHDIGTGTTTILPQICADTLGIDVARVSIQHGDTTLPDAGPVYGSSATMGVGSAVMLAARDALAKVARLAREPVETLDFAAAMRRIGVAEIVGDGRFALPGNASFNADGAGTPDAMRTWGAVFLEVGVDPDLGLVRLRRAVGSYSAGRIVNPLTARSQITGGIIWEWGKATMEQSLQEPRHGRWLAKNLSNVAIPVNADIPAAITVHFVEEHDEHASPLGAKGIGELGATGVAAAVANAVFDAVGIRVRELPILPSKLIRDLSS
ncbi:xanthine dehydrogenase family protein molybdopterin-binding subunit [Steroidobacter sp. S1-65]|uniref:Xanthine dehydrogenase family protein molybdopterin-binding subunit n=1 Tax=Steroidobacter gossypii TaxID=2805490 RepID=A0ABS1WTJ9_9GAMM|nr:xanthine dehydrogenase family protein molybdopterin-binding subunit [Steroidobacter gossypii]MBM0104273.1 xanthine dehydrogenase family protein molybdopterin-binding subunit [Steroidobacter gossypii]